MKNAMVLNLGPNTSNIRLCVLKLNRNEELEETFASLIETLKSKSYEMKKKTIVYCRSITTCGDIYEVLLENLSDNELHGMFHSKTPNSIQKKVLCEFLKRDCKMWLVVATCALGMGVDILDVELITHYGIPTEIERYVIMDFEPYFEDDPLLLGAAYSSNIRESSSDDNDSLQ